MDEEGLIPCVDWEYCHLIATNVLCGKSLRAPELWSEQSRIKPGTVRAILGDEYDSVERGPHRPARAGAGENDSVIYVVYKSSQALAEFVVTYKVMLAILVYRVESEAFLCGWTLFV